MPTDTAVTAIASSKKAEAERATNRAFQLAHARLFVSARAEFTWIMLLLFLYGGSPAPNVNEAHYLGKAKHFWDTDFCASDFFYNSQDAHTVFFMLIGSLTQFFDLPTVAWIGRLIGWAFLAVTWQRLCREVTAQRGWALLSAATWITLVDFCQMSGEWIIGGIEAKVLAYGFVFWALHTFLTRQYVLMWILLGAASAFHVLVGGWAVITMAMAWYATKSKQENWQLKRHITGCLIGGTLSLFGLLPALALNSGANAETVKLAQQIYVYERLPHHLLLSAFPSHFVLRHCCLLGLFLLVWYQLKNEKPFDRLAAFAGGAVVLLFVGAILDVALGRSEIGASVLRYYWFRESDIFVPMAVAIGASTWLSLKLKKGESRAEILLLVLTLSIGIYLTLHVTRWQRSWIPAADRQGGIRRLVYLREWRDVCRWIQQKTSDEATFLTPPEHQTFKWYAHRAEVVNWKDVPQDAQNLVEWSNRLKSVQEWQNTTPRALGVQRLDELRDRFHFDYLVTRWPTASPLPKSARPVYRNRRYAVFAFPNKTRDAASPNELASRARGDAN